jgi:exonuclease SbcC
MRINEFEEDIAKEPALRHDLDYARQQQVEAQTEVERAEASLAEVQGADLEYRHAEELLAAARYNIREREKDRITLFEEIERHQQRLATYQQIVANADSIRQGYAQLEEARSADLALGDKLRELNTLSQHISSLERQLSEARQEIELEQRELLTSIDNDRQIVIIGEQAKADLEEVDRLIMLLEALEAERDSHRENINGLKEELAELRTTNKTLKAEMEDIKARQKLINSAAEPRCPVCLQPLDEAHKQELHDKFQMEGTQRGDAFRANAIRMDEIRVEIQTLEAQAADAEKELKSLPTFRTRRGGLEQQIVAAVEAEQRIRTYQIKLDELGSILVKERFGEALRNQLQDAYAERDNLGYDSGTHDAVRENLNIYLVYQDKAKELEFAQQAIPQVEENLQNTQKRLERCEKSIQEYTQQAAGHETELERLKIKVAEMHRRQEEVSRQRTLLRNAEEKVNSVEQQLHSITQMRERRAKMIDRKAELQEKEGVYEQLKIAFSSKGVPAMIIEAAIPELEDAANRLLSRMTNNRMHLRFDTQREKKTGGVMETLDILISDELGTRDYSLYSGGEAFRVDFAIRIALSQMLARRAGAQLRTLFIDEGFGTQDAVGRERLVEAINSIQDDFDLILVITHIDELRDAFPALIEVTKTPKGSFATVR